MKTQFYSRKPKDEIIGIIAEFFSKEQAKTSDCIRKYCPENPTRLYQTGREHAISDLIRKLEIHDKKDVEE